MPGADDLEVTVTPGHVEDDKVTVDHGLVRDESTSNQVVNHVCIGENQCCTTDLRTDRRTGSACTTYGDATHDHAGPTELRTGAERPGAAAAPAMRCGMTRDVY
jgi:hypothetical protein